MHLPDGFLTAPSWASAWILSAGGVSYCLKRAKEEMKDRSIPLMGVLAAFIFVAQMINFPVVGGTSGHLLGGVLIAVMLGPFAGAVVMTTVLIVQCLVFQDGGITTLGANILNLSLVGTVGGYGVYRLLRGRSANPRRVLAAVFFAAWISILLAAASCALGLAFSGISPLHIVLPPMMGVHFFIGAGEGIITALLAGFILKVRPDLFLSQPLSAPSGVDESNGQELRDTEDKTGGKR
jgi:cobalt/nickel transport system permease protein